MLIRNCFIFNISLRNKIEFIFLFFYLRDTFLTYLKKVINPENKNNLINLIFLFKNLLII